MNPPPRRVMYFIWSLERGGAERQLVELVRGIDRARFDPWVVVCRAIDEFGYLLPHPLRSVGADEGFGMRSFARLVSHVREIRPDVVHTYMGSINFYGRVAARLARVPRVVGSVRCTELATSDVVREALTWPLVDATIVNSVAIRDELVRRAHVSPARIEVIENGVDLDLFRPPTPAERARVRSELGIEGACAVAVPGRICVQKNQLSVVRALALLRGQGRLPEGARFLFAGRVDGAERYAQDVRAVVEEGGLAPYVRWTGVVQDIERLLGAADAMLLASNFEGLPNVVLEAMACGTPVVVSPPANRDTLVHDGREGIECAGVEPEAIASALARFFAFTAGARDAMGRAGRAQAESRFSTARMVERTTGVYERLFGLTENAGGTAGNV